MVFNMRFLPLQVMWITLVLVLTVSSVSYQQDQTTTNVTKNRLATVANKFVRSEQTTEHYKSEILSQAPDAKICIGVNCSNVTDGSFLSVEPTSVDSLLSSSLLTSLIPSVETYMGQEKNSSVVLMYHNSPDQDNFTSNYTVDEEEFNIGENTDSVFNTGVIAGISALVVVILLLLGIVGFMIYRHFSWNRPQTLSDKFSNDESTGYIDDTALRENSEEMYSLDNDSFLNSLEAMTIQNYWTDQVKHTKL